MRIFLLVLLCLGFGVVAGVFADRHEQTRSWIEQVYQPASIPTASPVSAVPDLSGLTASETEFAGIYSEDTLAQYSIKRCFSSEGAEALSERPWLKRQENWVGLTDLTEPETFPDLGEYPGLVKIEIIHSRRGSDREHCGAVRVDEHWFLTAAHCIETEDPARALPVYDIIMLTPGLDVRAAEIKAAPIKGAMCHAEHGVSRLRYSTDIALFYVEDVSAFAAVSVANLERSSQHLRRDAFSKAYISGWGSNGGSRYLQGGPVSIIQHGESVLVSERVGERGPNVGDSGAPLYIDYGEGPLAVGVLSQVTQDLEAFGETGIFVRIKSIHDWIERTKAVCEDDGKFVC